MIPLKIVIGKTKLGLTFATAAALALLAVGCGGAGGQGDGGTMTIAYQPGIGYAQLVIAKQEGWLEEDLPNVEISWQQLSGGSAVRDGMLAGDIQVGAGGTGPFLVGYDAGVEWKVISALNEMDLWLMVMDEQYQNLEDLGDDTIAVPGGHDSIQSMVLRKGAQEQLGDAHALDSNMSILAHPDGLQALLSGQVAGHLTAPPFQFEEQDEGARPILQSFDIFGPHTFIVVSVLEDYHDDNPEQMEALYSSIQRATELLEDDPSAAAEILSEESGGENSPEEFERFITEDGVTYTMQPHALIAFAEFMQQVELIRRVPESCEELVFDNLSAEEC